MALCRLFILFWREKATCLFCEESSLSMHVAKPDVMTTPDVMALKTAFLRSTAKHDRNYANRMLTHYKIKALETQRHR